MTESSQTTRARIAPHWLVALLFALVAVPVAIRGTTVHDEGYVTWLGAAVLAASPVDGFFFQKFHPTISLVFAPFAALGFAPFIVAHAVAAASAIGMLGAVGRRWWGPGGWIAALVVALSPLFFEAAVTGYSNSTGTFFFALGLYLDHGSERRRGLAGVVLGASVWARYEQAPYVAGYLLYRAVAERDPRPLLGAVAWGAAYGGLGALYHGDPTWFVSHPPTLLVETMPSTIPELGGPRSAIDSVLTAWMLASPCLWFALTGLGDWRRDRRVAVLAAVLCGTLLLQAALPIIGGYFNYDFAPRYRINHLAFIALATAGVLVGWRRGPRVVPILLAVLGLGLAVYCFDVPGRPVFALSLLVPAAACALGARNATRAAVAVSGAVLVFGLVMPDGSYRHTRRTVANVPIAEIAETSTGAPIYTNDRLLDDQLRRAGLGEEVRFLVGYDIVGELGQLLHLDHRQTTRVLAALETRLYGQAEWPCRFPQEIEAGSLLFLTHDDRVDSVYDLDTWRAGSTLVERFDDGSALYRASQPIAIPAPSLPDWMPREYFCLPCGDSCHDP